MARMRFCTRCERTGHLAANCRHEYNAYGIELGDNTDPEEEAVENPDSEYIASETESESLNDSMYLASAQFEAEALRVDNPVPATPPDSEPEVTIYCFLCEDNEDALIGVLGVCKRCRSSQIRYEWACSVAKLQHELEVQRIKMMRRVAELKLDPSSPER